MEELKESLNLLITDEDLTIDKLEEASENLLPKLADSLNNLYTIEDYQKDSARTFLTKGSYELDILHCLVGMQTEIGELADAYKKSIYYDRPLDVVNVSEELADTFWYMANLARIQNIDITGALKNNISKLKIRFPDKFSVENANNRDLESERKELEK